MTDHELRMEERIAWACAVGMLVLVLAAMIWNRREVEQALPPADPGLLERITALEQRADEQARFRCLNVTTDRMDLAIFPADNLGKKKVEGR